MLYVLARIRQNSTLSQDVGTTIRTTASSILGYWYMS